MGLLLIFRSKKTLICRRKGNRLWWLMSPLLFDIMQSLVCMWSVQRFGVHVKCAVLIHVPFMLSVPELNLQTHVGRGGHVYTAFFFWGAKMMRNCSIVIFKGKSWQKHFRKKHIACGVWLKRTGFTGLDVLCEYFTEAIKLENTFSYPGYVLFWRKHIFTYWQRACRTCSGQDDKENHMTGMRERKN